MNNNNKIAFFLLGATLALGLGWSAHLIGSAIVKFKQENIIRVKGTSEIVIESDVAKWSCGVVSRNPDLKQAYLDLEQDRSGVLQYLSENGFAKDKIELSDIAIVKIMKKNETGETETNTVEFYELSQTFEIETTDVQRIKDISVSITDLVKAGTEITSESPMYFYTGLDALKMDLLGKASKNAYERAQILANNGGGKISNLASASQGVFQITPVNSTMISDDGTYNTSTIKKSVKCVVTLEFNLVK
ncbi:MAG: SIMPL domain-containing protein [Planctomycetaceae bacterium]